MNQSKIIRILDEQKMLLDNISDGAMIYRIKKSETRDGPKTAGGVHDIGEESESKQEIKVVYTNDTLNKMFKQLSDKQLSIN